MAITSGAYKKALRGNQRPKKALIKIDRVTKQFDETLAVNTVSLTINKGRIFALLGGSGSGKSTLLHMLADFERLTEGRIFLDGQGITDLPPYERSINIMFRSYALFPHMSVVWNTAFGPKQDGLPKAGIDERVAKMLKLVYMTQYAKCKSHQLPGGQRQRVVLARSLARWPKPLLLDRPMGTLDKKLCSQMQLELVETIERVGATCVMVAHDQEEAMIMAQRIAIMHLGCIERIGSPMDVYETPVSHLVREFVGNVNLFDGVLVKDVQGRAVIACSQLENPIYIGHDVSTRTGDKRITYVLRPGKVMISTQRPDNLEHAGYNWAQGTVCDIAYLGGHSVYYIKLVSGMVVRTLMASVERHAARPA